MEKWTSFLLFAALMWGVQGSGRKVRAQTRTRHMAKLAGRGEASTLFYSYTPRQLIASAVDCVGLNRVGR